MFITKGEGAMASKEKQNALACSNFVQLSRITQIVRNMHGWNPIELLCVTKWWDLNWKKIVQKEIKHVNCGFV